MLDLGTVLLAGLFYLMGWYGLSLIVIALSIVSGAGAVVRAIADPHSYQNKRAHAGLDIDFVNPYRGIGGLLITKALVIGVLLFAAYYVAERGGYL
jgi:hypothetical protein